MAAIKKDNWARALGFGALLVSLVSLFISSRTYFLSERPYLGITKVVDGFEAGDSSSPSRIRWAILFKNTGSLPAVGTVVKREVTVTHGQDVFKVPMRSLRDASISVMPGGEATLYGDVPENEHVPLALIKAGKASITDIIRVSYEPTKAVLWKSQYFYEARLQYAGGPGPAYFTLTATDAD